MLWFRFSRNSRLRPGEPKGDKSKLRQRCRRRPLDGDLGARALAPVLRDERSRRRVALRSLSEGGRAQRTGLHRHALREPRAAVPAGVREPRRPKQQRAGGREDAPRAVAPAAHDPVPPRARREVAQLRVVHSVGAPQRAKQRSVGGVTTTNDDEGTRARARAHARVRERGKEKR